MGLLTCRIFFQLIHITVLYDPWLVEFAGVEWWIQRANCKITQRFEDFQQCSGVAPLIPVLYVGVRGKLDVIGKMVRLNVMDHRNRKLIRKHMSQMIH